MSGRGESASPPVASSVVWGPTQESRSTSTGESGPGAQPRDRVLARLLHVDAASVGLTVSLHVVLPPLVRRRHAAPHPTWGGGGHESSRAAGSVEVEQQGAEPSVGSVGSVSSSPARRQEPSVLFSRRPLRWEGTRPFQAQAAEAAEALSTERPILRRLALLRL